MVNIVSAVVRKLPIMMPIKDANVYLTIASEKGAKNREITIIII